MLVEGSLVAEAVFDGDALGNSLRVGATGAVALEIGELVQVRVARGDGSKQPNSAAVTALMSSSTETLPSRSRSACEQLLRDIAPRAMLTAVTSSETSTRLSPLQFAAHGPAVGVGLNDEVEAGAAVPVGVSDGTALVAEWVLVS